MKVGELIAELQQFDGDMDVFVRCERIEDDGDGWNHSEYDDCEIRDVGIDTYDRSNWINPSSKKIIAINI